MKSIWSSQSFPELEQELAPRCQVAAGHRRPAVLDIIDMDEFVLR